MTLLTIEAAAQRLNVPAASLRTAAQQHGMLVRMGRALRIDPDTLPELVEKCREKPQGQGSVGAPTKASGASATQASPTSQQVQQTALMLRKLSRRT